MLIRKLGGTRDLRIFTVSKPIDTQHITDIVLTDDPHLEFPVVAGRRYLFYMTITAFALTSTPGIRYSLTTPADTVTHYARSFGTAFTTAPLYNTTITGTLAGGVVESALFCGFLIPTVSGVVHWQSAQNVSNADPTNILAGSALMVIETN